MAERGFADTGFEELAEVTTGKGALNVRRVRGAGLLAFFFSFSSFVFFSSLDLPPPNTRPKVPHRTLIFVLPLSLGLTTSFTGEAGTVGRGPVSSPLAVYVLPGLVDPLELDAFENRRDELGTSKEVRCSDEFRLAASEEFLRAKWNKDPEWVLDPESRLEL